MSIAFIIAALFLAALTVWEAWRLKLSYRAYFARRREGTKWGLLPDLGKVAGGFLFAYLFIASALVSGAGLKAVYGFLFALAIVVEQSYARVLGHFTNTTDMLAVVHVDAGTRRDAIRGFVDPWSLIPVAVFGLLLTLVRLESPQYLAWSLVTWIFGVGLFTLMGLYARDEEFPTPGLSALFRSLLFFVTRKAPSPRQAVSLAPRPAGFNVIFIVDETIRADHLSVNGYHRKTTPYLEALRQQGSLVTWGTALGGDSLSFPSNHALLTGIYPAGDPRTETAPSIFQYARARGYRVYYYDAWGPAFWLGTPADLNDVDQHRHNGHYAGVPGYDLDNAIAREIHALLAAEPSQPKFVWVNKRGAHYGYQHCYPAERAIWKPELRDSDSLNKMDAAKHERLVNAYDNALHYNLNGFFQTLLGPGQSILKNTLILYTADHAETLSDNGENWSHGRGTPSELMVPAILVSAAAVEPLGGTAAHSNLFATLLTMMDIPPSEWAQPYEPPLFTLAKTHQPAQVEAS